MSMHGKVCLITGATTGIGKHTALALARQDATVVIGCRDAGRGAATAEEIRRESGNPAVSVLRADLSQMAEVRRMADELMRQHQALHVLVNNAGAIYMEREVTPEGLERTFATNHLAYFLLTERLLPLLRASAPARVINVSSQAHRPARIDFDDLMGERGYSGWRAYGQSKLANVLHTYELARRLAGSGVTANCLHPGVIASGFGRNNRGLFGLILRLAPLVLLTPEQGARTSIYLATSPEVEGVSGRYFDRCRAVASSRASYDEAAARRLWEVSEQLTRG
jgi:NAD(P)-dependent dehydrogenase (short-subunit alcohol dehydrogenase family)